MRDWLARAGGWLEPELILQLRLGREVPAVGARRLQLNRDIEAVIAPRSRPSWVRAGTSPPASRPASLIAALGTVEEAAAAHMEQDGRGLTAAEIDRLLDDAVAFVDAGVSAVATG